MIDTHCHLDSKDFTEDLEKVINDAFAQGVSGMIIPATEPSNFTRVEEISLAHKNVFFALGVHPHNAHEYNKDVEQNIESKVEQFNGKLVAIGEIGLDYYYNFAPRNVQIDSFRKQLKLAKKLNLPAIVHNRDSNEDLLKIIEEEQDGNLKLVLHCFSENDDFLWKVLDLGCYVSFTGNITFKKNLMEGTIKSVPNNRFFLETDSPFMTPVPFRGKRNEPKFIEIITNKIAEIKSMKVNEVIEMTTRNAKHFFNLVMVLLLLFIPFTVFANSFETDTIDNTNEIIELSPIEYYQKFIGFGANFGSNTIVVVKRWKVGNATQEFNSAWEGKFFWGAHISYSPIDFLITRLEYTYTNDLHQYQINDNKSEYTNIYRILSFDALVVLNPSSRINYFLGIGPSVMFNTYNMGNPYYTSRTKTGINGTLGFLINIPIPDAGLLTLSGEWLLLFDLSQDETYDLNFSRNVTNYYFYSMPRFTFTFFPEFLYNLR